MEDKNHFQFYCPYEKTDVFLIGPFNKWGKDKNSLDNYRFSDKNFPIYTYPKNKIKHKTPYLFLVNNLVIRDPEAVYFNQKMECIYWDYNSNDAYKQKYNHKDLKFESNIILQSDLPGLIKWFRATKGKYKGKLGSEIDEREYFNFITNSGVLDKIKELGFNTIQFLPVTKSIDGNDWKFRYLSQYPYAINDNWGNPDDFSKMIDTFHENDIAFIHDAIYSHVPYKNYTMNGIEGYLCKLPSYFYGEETTWGTKRYDYANEFIRKYLTNSAIHFLDNYKIDGFRIDNVDGILRYGENGDGEERVGGREFLRQLNSTIYRHYPDTVINFEAHYFAGENAKNLIGNIHENERNLGATAYSSSRENFYFQSEYMIKSSDKIRASRIREIIEEKEWGQSNSTVADFHNHDAAAGLMEGRATGSYAYDAMILNNHHLHYHAIGKIKVMESIISLCLEGRALDLLQTFLLQTGTFDHDSSIHWYLEMIEANKALLNFKKEINELMKDEDFWPKNIYKRKLINVDEDNKTLTFQKGKHLIFINMSGDMIAEYEIPLRNINQDYINSKDCFELVFNSDEFKFCGSGRVLYPDKFDIINGNLKIDWVASYGILVFKKI